MTVKMPYRTDPTIHVVAGPNGAGKTTFARTFLPELGCARFLNADLIAAGLSPLSPAAGAVRAARILLTEWDALVEARASFGFETTLSGRAYAARLKRARGQGYTIAIYYLWLPSVTVALRRIRQRVTKGGTMFLRAMLGGGFALAWRILSAFILPLAEEALLFDGSTRPSKLVAEIQKGRQIVREKEIYEQIKQAIQER